ncbi:hypothetical protein [Marinifilum caeruleilacunae]|uniref:Uncharacterized protein n=1 Tax=Marinifilum caeruleilacunae TaxID=2499076 RepID=A0ABX1WXU2_9BACT|nr:hypothetical protein [Marinifilum caeruleilacunae]NOU60942.1 hypothetical protein [Marinifilum caeruleilacunae]
MFYKKKEFIISLLMILFVGYYIADSNRYYDGFKNDSTKLFSIKFEGKVEDINVDRGWVTIVLKNDESFSIRSSANNNYNPRLLSRFLRINDSIYKPSNSDTLYVFKEKRKYYFIMETLKLNE